MYGKTYYVVIHRAKRAQLLIISEERKGECGENMGHHHNSRKKTIKKEKKSSRNNGNRSAKGPDSLRLSLNAALLECRYKMLEEFPAILQSLDSGEFVHVDRISDSVFRGYLQSILTMLPSGANGCGVRQDPQLGYYREKRVAVSIVDCILSLLLESRTIAHPKDLSASQQQCSRKAPMVLLSLIDKYPKLIEELPALLYQIEQGNAVQLRDIKDEELAEGLEELLRSLGLIEGSDGYGLPVETAVSRTMAESIKYFTEIFNDHMRYLSIGRHFGSHVKDSQKKIEKSDRPPSPLPSQSRKSDSSSSESSSSSSDDNDDGREKSDESDEESSKGAADSAAPIKGPTRPSKSELMMAQIQARTMVAGEYKDLVESSDEDNDDVMGPQLLSHRTSSNRPRVELNEAVLPLGFVGADSSFLSADTPGSFSQTNEHSEVNSNIANKREEWLLTPGDSKALQGEPLFP